MIKKIFAVFFSMSVIALSCSASFSVAAKQIDAAKLRGTEINVYNWGEYISDGSEGTSDVNKEFEKETGIKVNYTTYDSNENMYNK
ncbi:MAG: spermidine/putrescine ABC transporter substrate-binding protein, partial [Clostridiaceae bacterium]|nr:spermidine/putrescine ABC transporter substrate-binding protein [Clostridiaceae bacterium]MDY5889929.1 spermidine/putrescine ABC transporter substrate-binding protein [Oscillospiraceae bacterium]